MDVIIPAHNIKILSSSISTLSKIGKILYLEFDPLDGLTIRTLNDAKSSFCHFHFDVGFFERCTSSAATALASRSNNNDNNDNNNMSSSTNGGGEYSNLELGTRNSKVRNRNKGKDKRGRSRSNGNRNNRVYSRSRSRRRRTKKRSRSRSTPGTGTSSGSTHENDTTTDEEEEETAANKDEKYFCKIPIRNIVPILRPRKGTLSLRIKSVSTTASIFEMSSRNHHHDNENISDDSDNEEEEEEIGSRMQLSFEYQIQTDGIMRVMHKVGVSDAQGIIAIASKQHCSEIVTLPKIFLTMLDQVKSSTEVALTVNDGTKIVIASSFHYGDTTFINSCGEGGNVMMNASNAAILKTETSIDCSEFEDFQFMDDDAIQSVIDDEDDANNGDGGGTERHSTLNLPPDRGSEQVTLVFSIKEAKAMLQFCAASQFNYVDDEDARIIISFYWGGRPIIIETEGEAFHGELILATVDHSLLNGMNTRHTNVGSTHATSNTRRSSTGSSGAARD